MFHRRRIPFRWIFPCGQLALSWIVTSFTYSFPAGWLFKRNIFHTVFMLNVPAILFELPLIPLRHDSSGWSPPGIDLFLWRAVTWPLFASVFW
jgi:hypothetical protein